MDGLYNGAGTKLFTSLEQGGVAATNLTAESMDYDGDVRPLTVHLYPLSVMEIYDYSASKYVIDEALLVTEDIADKLNGNEYGWWTRTNDFDTNVVRVGGRNNPSPGSDDIRDSMAVRGVRPAFNLNADSVLFASAAVGGKSAAGMGAGLTAVSPTAPAEWKLTLKDADRSGFSIATTNLSSTSATIDYVGAKTGTNEYISAMIVDNGSVAYYGRIKSLPNVADASGAVTISIPSGVTLDADTTLRVFNEQFNGDKMTENDTSRAYTDCASELITVMAPAPVVTEPTSGRTAPVTVGSPATLSVTATDATGYQWWINRGAGFEPIPDATNASYTTAPVTLDNQGYQYRCIVTGNGEAISPVFTLNVTEEVKVPATGDESMPGLWMGLMLMTGTVLAGNRALHHGKRKAENG